MRISFDLDRTLLAINNEFPREHSSFFHKILGIEALRKGATTLIKKLQEQGHEVWVYTTSQRPRNYINELFLRNNIRLNGIINRKHHIASVDIEMRQLSKYPPAFNIEVHVDDSQSVHIDGQVFGFMTILVSPEDTDWAERVYSRIKEIESTSKKGP